MKGNKSNENECSRLVTKPFSAEEKEQVKAARRRLGVDRPVFYHDAVVAYANGINEEASNV